MSESDIATTAPVAPACFPSRTAWVQYLVSAQEIKTNSTKPFTHGSYNAAFNYCADCTSEHRLQMCRAGRCHPPEAAIRTGDIACA